MSAKIKIPESSDTPVIHDEQQEFIKDVQLGFSKANKSIPSKYFYDEKGSEIFNQITRNPDYYLTGCEFEILDFYKKDLATFLQNDDFNLIELGPGEGIKTRLLIDEFLAENLRFTYYPIDISPKYLNQIVESFNQDLPRLDTIALKDEYLHGLKWLSDNSTKRNFLLFLGSSIGNFKLAESKEFLKKLHQLLHPGDYVLIGFDLLKKIESIWWAYNDRDGLTREFNLNLLRRMNKELGANFNLNSFDHYGSYNVQSHAMESYLISNKAQIVYIDTLKKSFNFNEYEAIHTESSQKYTLSDINKLASISQFKIIKNFTDRKHYFINSLWQV